MDAHLAAKLRRLAERVSRSVPQRRDPERFYVEKSCIVQDLEHLTSQIEERQERKLQVTRQRKSLGAPHLTRSIMR